MTNDIKQLFHIAANWQLSGDKIVLATVVDLEGSSYRRPGVRMIISDKGDSFGTVSGGCIEKEIRYQAQSVFNTGRANIIYLLLEPFVVTAEILEAFNSVLEKRQTFRTEAYYYSSVGEFNGIGTLLIMNNKIFSLNPSFHSEQIKDQNSFSQKYPPIFQLHIFGAEHDAVQLCRTAHLLGWEITIVASPDEDKSIDYFPGADRLITPAFHDLDTSVFDEQSAIVVMTHSFNKDVQYLIALNDVKPAYFGLLGPKQRRERVLSALLDYCPDTSPEFLEQLYGPAGINIGAENATEIAISILAEILSKIRDQKPMALKDKAGSIHG
jgi:xanthine/CO dehydrogenase XdhC/CoxF family maturation factor